VDHRYGLSQKKSIVSKNTNKQDILLKFKTKQEYGNNSIDFGRPKLTIQTLVELLNSKSEEKTLLTQLSSYDASFFNLELSQGH
jgi:hypothetical protein